MSNNGLHQQPKACFARCGRFNRISNATVAAKHLPEAHGHL
jgi:hypothetical protein